MNSGLYSGIANYNTWYIKGDVFSIGFFDGFNMTLDGNENFFYSIMIGPAVMVKIKNIVRFHFGAGVNFGGGDLYMPVLHEGYYSTYTSHEPSPLFGVGLALDFSLEFLPTAVFSPILGVQWITINSNKLKSEFGDYVWNCNYKYKSFRFFIGGEFNFGKKINQ